MDPLQAKKYYKEKHQNDDMYDLHMASRGPDHMENGVVQALIEEKKFQQNQTLCQSAEKSAGAAENSAKSAHRSVWVSVLALVVSIASIFSSCEHPAQLKTNEPNKQSIQLPDTKLTQKTNGLIF